MKEKIDDEMRKKNLHISIDEELDESIEIG
jgi:hypothetical protein